MRRLRRSKKLDISIPYVTSGILTILVLLLLIPMFPAVTAGIASVSIILFGIPVILLIISFVKIKISRRVIALCLLLSLFGLVYPQVSLYASSVKTRTNLVFNPLSYVTFTGETSIPPTKVVTFKETPQSALRMAYYAGEGSEDRPAVILLHGGGWQYGSHLETGDWPRILTQAGFSVFSAEYRLSTETYASWQDTPSDVHDAVTYVTDHASNYEVNADAIVLMGQSAGGHLALLEAYKNRSVSSVINLYGPVDLTLDYTTSRDKSTELNFIGGPPILYPKRYEYLSPLNYVTSASPRTLIVQGQTDDLVAYQNAPLLANKLSAHDVSHSTVLLPLTGHSFENQRGGFATQIAEQTVIKFLKH